MNNKFRIKTPVPEVSGDKSLKIDRFTKAGESRDDPNYSNFALEEEKPNKSFTVPLNESELELLRRAAKKDNRSQRYIARLLLVEAMKKYLDT